MKQRYALQSPGLWLAFLLSVVPVVAAVIWIVMATTTATGLVQPEKMFWDNFDAATGKAMGGCEIIGWRVGPFHVSSLVMNGIGVLTCILITLGWYRLIWGWGARRESQKKQIPPTTT